MKKIKIIILSLCLVILFVLTIAYNYYQDRSIIDKFNKSQMDRYWIEKGINNYYMHLKKYPDDLNQVLELYKKEASESDYKTAKMFFIDPFTGNYYKLIKVKDGELYIGQLAMSACYGGKFSNELKEVDIKNIKKLKYYPAEHLGYLTPSFFDYLIRNKDFIKAYYNHELNQLDGRYVKNPSKLNYKIHKATKSRNPYTFRAKVISIENNIIIEDDSVKFLCKDLNAKLNVGDTVNIYGILECTDAIHILHDCKIWDFELTYENVMHYKKMHYKKF